MADGEAKTTVCRALGHYENDVLHFTRERSFIIVYNLTLTTTKPISDEDMLVSLHGWRAQYPMLRMGVYQEGGLNVFKEVNTGSIDYERVNGKWLDVFNTMLDTPFKETGPLWRVKLIAEPNQGEPSEYSYALLVSWCHVITDGTSNVIMCNSLMEHLDAQLDGKKFNPGSVIKVNPPIEELLPKKDYLWSEVVGPLKEDLAAAHQTALWSKVFPANRDVPPRTYFVDLGQLDAAETSKLVARCKKEGATVHGALITAIHVALHKVYTKNPWTQNNIADDNLTIMSGHAVNARRCYENSDGVFGYNISGCSIPYDVSSSTPTSFWKVAKEATGKLRTDLSVESLQMKLKTIYTLHDGESQINDTKENPTCALDYGASNMRNIDSMFPGVYNNVAVTWFARSTGVHYYGFPLAFNATTFRGKFLLTVDCVTTFATDEQARFIGKVIFDLLRDNL